MSEAPLYSCTYRKSASRGAARNCKDLEVSRIQSIKIRTGFGIACSQFGTSGLKHLALSHPEGAYLMKQAPAEDYSMCFSCSVLSAPPPSNDVHHKMRQGPVYRGTSLMRKSTPLGPCSGIIPRGLWWS
jgi:hypothetical protein